MALGSFEKIRIDGVLRNNEDFYYEDFCLPRRKYTDDELIEYLLKLIINFLSSDREEKNKTLERYLLALYVIFEYCILTDRTFSDDLAKRSIALKNDYLLYLNRLNLESDKRVLAKLSDLVTLLVENRTFVDEKFLSLDSEEENVLDDNCQNDSSYEELQKKIRELENKLSSYEKDEKKKDSIIKELKSDIFKLNNKVQNYQREIAKKDKTSQEFQALILEKDQKLEASNSTIFSLREKIVDKDIAIKKAGNETFAAKKTQKELNKVIKDQREKIAIYTSKEQRESELQTIENEIFLLLSKKQMNVKEIKEELNKRGLVVTNEELQFLLTRIRNKISIEPSNKTIPRSYHIEKINYNKRKFNLETEKFKLITNGQNIIKILLIADPHSDIRKMGTFDVYEYGYDYCLANDIENIFLLGDIFDCSCRYNLETRDGFCNTVAYYKENIEKFLEIYPNSDGIINSFLGGNHEKMMLDAGFNPVELIANERLDFISLGYNDAAIEIANGQIMLHHPNRVLALPKKQAALKYLRDFYKNSKKDRRDYYIDIFGHFHVNYLNQSQGYALISSLTRSENANGACEIRITLNEKGFISNIVFVPLVCNRKGLDSAGEIEYKKLVLENK